MASCMQAYYAVRQNYFPLDRIFYYNKWTNLNYSTYTLVYLLHYVLYQTGTF